MSQGHRYVERFAAQLEAERERLIRTGMRMFPVFGRETIECALGDVTVQVLADGSYRVLFEAGALRVGEVFYWMRARLFYALNGRWRRGQVRQRHSPSVRMLCRKERLPDQRLLATEALLRGDSPQGLAQALMIWASQDAQLMDALMGLVREIANRKAWLESALEEHIRSWGRLGPSELACRHGGHLSAARSIVSRKLSALYEGLVALVRGSAAGPGALSQRAALHLQ